LSQNISSRHPTFKAVELKTKVRAREIHSTLPTEHFFTYWSTLIELQAILLLVLHYPRSSFHKTITHLMSWWERKGFHLLWRIKDGHVCDFADRNFKVISGSVLPSLFLKHILEKDTYSI
jgi:hypothetical protein